jgi:hypothetical protein
MTIPLGTANVERSFSTMKRVKTPYRSTMKQERLQALCKISIEKDILFQIRLRPDFYDRVINKFCEKTRRMDFIYK